ncbi:hypothetical protein HDU93_006564 [Gonapodya sp. JEL0774]|nr:hypothetical protein HDU93_006564 [Gonapodya sp. JEL0774]
MPPSDSYVLNAFIHTHEKNPLYGAPAASVIGHSGVAGAYSGAVIGGAHGWWTQNATGAVIRGAARGTGLGAFLAATYVGSQWFVANYVRETEDSWNAPYGGAVVGALIGAASGRPTRFFMFPLIGAAVAIAQQRVTEVLVDTPLTREGPSLVPSQRGTWREGFWAPGWKGFNRA